MEFSLSNSQLPGLATAIFFAILFLQSGLNKLADWKGNLSWLKDHFGKTPFRNTVPLMLGTLTAVEVAAGVLSAAGAVLMLVNGNRDVAEYGIGLAALALLMLFFGQRIAKDYAGAANLAIYFGVAVLGLLVL